MLQPNKQKYKKQFRGKMRGKASSGTEIAFGEYAIYATTSGWISSQQIEAGRRVLTRYTRKGGRVWIRIYPDKPVTDKPAEASMGGGKGDVAKYVAVVKPGRVIFEMGGVEEEHARDAMKQAASKLPVKTKFLTKKE